MPYPILHTDSCHFSVWAPEREAMTLHLLPAAGQEQDIVMQKNTAGYFEVLVPDVRARDRYYYRPEGGKDFPDPCSCFQPGGVHGPSEVVDQGSYAWNDSNWKGKPLASLIFYEVHPGAFTPEGDLEAIIARLDDIAATGINAIELMPVAQCPGNRNWGYDGVFLYAVQHSYGGPEGLKKLVDACHGRGIAVYLDVVYNHLGREGNCLPAYGPYLSETYCTPWGKALNFDGAWSDGVREFVIGNALYWAEHFHLDGLRLDAVHEIYDRNAITLWDELHAAVRQWEQQSGRPFYLIAESDLNSPRTVSLPESGGQGFDAQWLDDFHHALYVLLDPEGRRHYRDYGELQQLARAYTEGFVFNGDYVHFRHRRHGASSAGLPGDRFLVFNQNHDLPGNRPGGERLSVLLDLERLKLAAAAVLLSPYIPMLFMGEEYGEDSPFYFFSDYGDPQVAEELRSSRKQQFAGFGWDTEAPDPQKEETFFSCKLNWNLRGEGQHRLLLDWHRRLIGLRQTHPLLTDLSKKNLRADLLGTVGLAVLRHSTDRRQQLLCLFNFYGAELAAMIPYTTDAPWTKVLSSQDQALPQTIDAGGTVLLPSMSASVYAIG